MTSHPATIDSIYKAPDIRTAKLEEAIAHLDAKRTRRLTVIQTFQEKYADKLQNLADKQLVAFEKRVEQYNKALERVDKAIEALSTQVTKLNEINHGAVNIEQEYKDFLGGE